MPEMGGIDATQTIRMRVNKQPIIIALTADVLLENQEQFTSAGFDDIITKPIDKIKLSSLLQKYV